MGRRREELRRRVVRGALDLVADRAPWLGDQAYRVLSGPLQWVDPEGAARSAHDRLDAVRDRVAAMAGTGRVPRAELRRIARDLARTREDLARIGSRLPPVQAAALAGRVESYTGALQELTVAGGPAARRRRLAAVSRETMLLTGATASACAGLLATGAGGLAVGGAVAVGAVGAVGAAGVRGRQQRREVMSALASSLVSADRHLPAPGGVAVADLDRGRTELLRRVERSRRLDARGTVALRSIGGHLDELLVRLLREDLDPDVAHLVEASVTRYLPDTLEPFLALDDPAADIGGRPAAVEVADQLAALDRALGEARERPGRHRPQTQLHLQGEFLREKFRSSGA